MRILSTILCVMVAFQANDGIAQSAPGSEEAVSEERPAAPEEAQTNEQLQKEIQQLKERMQAREREIEDQLNARDKLLNERMSEIEEASFEQNFKGDTQEVFSVYGWFDMGFMKRFIDDEAIIKGLAFDTTSFYIQHMNLFFLSQMTSTLSFITELRFSFAPMGYEGGLEISGSQDYERTDTEVLDFSNGERFDLGGVKIERAHVTWQAAGDYLGIIAGFFLTPFGIWNVDHGTHVIIPVRPPFMQVEHYIPLSQLGIQFYGRFLPGKGNYIDYAVTVSNGRGPMDTVYDLDDNKAVGLRLKYTRESDHYRFSIGGYGYYGDYTDVKKRIASFAPFHVDIETTVSYHEYIGTLDLLIELYGVRLQSEILRSYIQYTKRGPRAQAAGPGYQPDYVVTDVYGLLAYELPLERWLGDMTITPYVMFEYTVADDSRIDTRELGIFYFGINFRPLPYVVFKAEVDYVYNFALTEHWMTVVSGQMAVSF